MLVVGAALGWALVVFGLLGLAVLFTPAHEWTANDQLALLGAAVGVAGFGATFVALSFAVVQMLPAFADPQFVVRINTLHGTVHEFIPHVIAQPESHVPHAEDVFARPVGRIQVMIALESGSVTEPWQFRITALGACLEWVDPPGGILGQSTDTIIWTTHDALFVLENYPIGRFDLLIHEPAERVLTETGRMIVPVHVRCVGQTFDQSSRQEVWIDVPGFVESPDAPSAFVANAVRPDESSSKGATWRFFKGAGRPWL